MLQRVCRARYVWQVNLALRLLPAALVAALVAPLVRCADPTALDVVVYSEVPCSANARAALAGASAASDLIGRPPSGTSAGCTPDLAPMNALGHVVLTPSASKDGTVAFAVMQRPDGASPDDCLDPARSAGCIVAKRWLRYRPQADVPIRVDLRLSCESVSCPADQTCVKGACRPLAVSDATDCPSEDGCRELSPADAGPDAPVCTSSFLPTVAPETGNLPVALAVADFNGDKKPDLAVTNNLDGTVSVLLGNGNGTFAPKVDYSVGVNPSNVAVGDFNGDSKPDLAVANQDSNTVSVLFGGANGTFAAKVDYATGTSPYDVAAGDFNGDQTLDVAVTSATSNTVSVLINVCK